MFGYIIQINPLQSVKKKTILTNDHVEGIVYLLRTKGNLLLQSQKKLCSKTHYVGGKWHFLSAVQGLDMRE